MALIPNIPAKQGVGPTSPYKPV